MPIATKINLAQVAPNVYEYQTAKGPRFCVRFSWRNRAFKKKGFKTVGQAQSWIRKRQVAQDERRFFPEQVSMAQRPLRDIAEKWIAQGELRALKQNTIRSYRMNLRVHILPSLGDFSLGEITRQDVKQLLLAKKAEGLSANAVRLVLAPLSKMFSDAYDDGLVKQNPCFRPGRIAGMRTRKKEVDPFLPDEEAKLLESAERDLPAHYPLVLTLFRAGLRIGEAIALERTDLDFQTRFLAIRRNYTNGVLEALPKNNHRRHVDMSKQLAAVLKAHIERLDLEAAMQGRPVSALIFPNTEGGYFDIKNWRRRTWYPFLERLSIRRRPPHYCRHSFASRLLSNGESLSYVQEQMGHSSIAVTKDVYGHLVPGANKQAVDRLDTQE